MSAPEIFALLLLLGYFVGLIVSEFGQDSDNRWLRRIAGFYSAYFILAVLCWIAILALVGLWVFQKLNN